MSVSARDLKVEKSRRARLPTEIEEKLRACETTLKNEIAELEAVATVVDDITEKVESGEIIVTGGVPVPVDDDPSMVRHINELRREVERERRESPGVEVLLGTRARGR